MNRSSYINGYQKPALDWPKDKTIIGKGTISITNTGNQMTISGTSGFARIPVTGIEYDYRLPNE